jgi:hypothetical protein
MPVIHGNSVAARRFGKWEIFGDNHTDEYGDQQVSIFIEKATPKQLVDLIDQKFSEGKKKGLSRLSIEWGIWSRKMNLYVRKKIDENGPNSTLFGYVMIYWTIKSQLLELNFRSRIGKLGKKNRLKNEAVYLKKVILNPPGNLKDVSMNEIAMSIAALGVENK